MGRGYNMSSMSCARTSYVDIAASRIFLDEPMVSSAGVRKAVQLFAFVLGAASLAACAQSSVVTNKSELLTASRQASLEHNRKGSFVTNRHAAVTKKHTPFASDKNAAETQDASYGLASFYTEGTQTASGEKFDAHELTAAHRTLPFGTRVRVINQRNGRSVTVRINDRGPFVRGRVIDLTPAGARALGFSGLAPVKLEIDHTS